MRIEIGAPGIKRIFGVTVSLLIVSLMLPVAVSGPMQRFFLVAQVCLSGGAFILAALRAWKDRGRGTLRSSALSNYKRAEFTKPRSADRKRKS